MEEVLWVEKYRPKSVDDCILPKSVKDQFKSFVESGNIPTLLLNGTAGSGKTSIAKAMCNDLGCDYMFINMSKERGIDTLRGKISDYASRNSLVSNTGRKMIICDESDSMTPELQSGLKAAIEEFSATCGFIFTCNLKNKIIEPIHSRCMNIDFSIKKADKPKMMAGIMKRIKEILDIEGVGYDDKVLATLIMTYFPDIRRTLNEIQRYSMGKNPTIDSGILANIQEVKIDKVVGFLKKQDFKAMRQWIGENSDIIDQNTMFTKLFNSVDDILEPSSVPSAVLIIAEYAYKASFVADPEINLTACLTELMAEVAFK